jgi:hypothetical protein
MLRLEAVTKLIFFSSDALSRNLMPKMLLNA